MQVPQQFATVTGLYEDGSGLFTTDSGLQVVVPGALPGDKVEYAIVHKSPHQPLAWARCLRTVTAGPNHVRPACSIAAPTRGRCGGCPLMHLRPKLQASFKQDFVISSLRNAGINYIDKILFNSATETLGYRNRTDYVVVKTPRGKVILGSYEPRSHRVIGMPTCPILRRPMNMVSRHLSTELSSANIPIYPEERGIRYISLFANAEGRVIIDLVCGDDPTPWLECFIGLARKLSMVAGITYSMNASQNNALRVAPSRLAWGVDRLPEKLGNVETCFSASGFTQLNFDTAARMYAKAREWARKPRILWDLYCGAGAFGRTVAPSKMLFGAEISPISISFARDASKNDPWQSVYEVVDLGRVWPSWPKPDVIIVNPPRKGLDPLMMERFLRSPQVPLIYMSCNPQTFAQNAAILSKQYIITQIEAFDMMPQTKHVEVLAYFTPRMA